MSNEWVHKSIHKSWRNKSIQLSSGDILTRIMAFPLAMLGEKETVFAQFPLRLAMLFLPVP